METIKKYLESMFQNLPSTPQVLKAKAELYSMMEDKYSELIREGRTENEAVGTVIAEFGNLEELADDLGLASAMRNPHETFASRRVLSFDEVSDCLDSNKITSLLIAAGVAFCILCPVPVIFASGIYEGRLEGLGILTMFLFLAAGVACLIFSGITSSKWDYIEKEYCMLDYSSVLFVKDEKAKFNSLYAIFLTLGIVLCVICAVPAIVIESFSSLFPFWYEISGAFVLILVAIGVFMIVWVGIRMGRLNKLLKLNDRPAPGEAIYRAEGASPYTAEGGKSRKNEYTGSSHNSRNYGERYSDYSSSWLDLLLSVYKPTVTCIYLIWSFLTFDWHITWIIWPISGLVRKILINIRGGK